MGKKNIFKEFLMCPECGNAIIDKKLLEDRIDEYKDSRFCTKCGQDIASTYKEALENIMSVFCTEQEKETGNIKLSPPRGEESIIIRSVDEIETLKESLLDYFR